MILILANVVLISLRWLCTKMRYGRYASTMHKILQHTGLFIERAMCKTQASVTAMKLLNSSTSFQGLNEVLLEDSYLRMHRMNSKAEIDLTSWFAYKSTQRFPDNLRVLVEVEETFAKESEPQEFNPSSYLHVLTCGSVLAWRVESPLGVILACDSSDLIQLIDAFGQDSLVLSNGLEISGIATVRTKGWPRNLISKEDDIISLIPGIEQEPMQKEQEESLNSTLSRSVGSEKEHSPAAMPELDKTDGKDKTDDETSSTELWETERVNPKPPNIHVYCGVKDTARKFSEAKATLQSCVNTDAYIVYLLTHENLISNPWQRSTAALVITACDHLRSDAVEKIENFLRSLNGNVISFNSSIDKCFSPEVKSSFIEQSTSERFTKFSFKTWDSVSSVSGPFVYSKLSDQSQIIVPFPHAPEETTDSKSHSRDESDSGISISSDEAAASWNSSENALVVKVSPDGGGTIILSQLLLERDPASFAIDDKSFTALKKSNTDRLSVLKELLGLLDIDTHPGPVPRLTCCHLLSQITGLREVLISSFKDRLTTDNILKSRVMSLKFHALPDDKEEIKANLLPVTTHCESDLETDFFDLENYWSNLETRSMGQLVFYTDVITSTMTVFGGLLFSIPDGMAPVAIAGRQTSGRGRAGNAWLSPVGCAMFTVPIKLTLDSELGSHLSCLQHVVAVAVIQSVVTLPGYENINVRLKWPNDIYFGREIKLGGVMVTSSVMGNELFATIGCGFNVSNSNPTMCINDIIKQYNSSNPDLPPLDPLTPGQLVGRALTILEYLVDDFQRNGSKNFFELYYKYWLHGGTRVKIELDTKTEGEIVGLDKYGFLSLRTKEGKLISVQPDGNSFDMMHNLIHFKTTQ